MISKELLENLYLKQGLKQNKIAEMFGITQATVSSYCIKYKLKKAKKETIKTKNHGKPWTEEQKNFLIDNFGRMSYKAIANSEIIQRKPSAVQQMRRTLKLGDSRTSDEYLTVSYLSKQLNIEWKTVKRWGEKHGLKITKRNLTNKMLVTRVKLSTFWKWAKEHTNLIKWNKFEEGALGLEPTWVKEARKIYRETHPEKEGLPWTNEDDILLTSYRKIGLTIPQIAKNMKRSERAIDGRLTVIEAERKKKKTWDEKELERLKKFVKEGLTSKQIAEKMEITIPMVEGARERYITRPRKQIEG